MHTLLAWSALGGCPPEAHRGSRRRLGVTSAGNSGSQAPEHGLEGRVHTPREGQGQPIQSGRASQHPGPRRASSCLGLKTVLMEDIFHAAVRG